MTSQRRRTRVFFAVFFAVFSLTVHPLSLPYSDLKKTQRRKWGDFQVYFLRSVFDVVFEAWDIMVAFLPSSIIVFHLFLHSTRLFSDKTFVCICFTATSFDEFVMHDFANIDDFNFDIVELVLLQRILSTFLIGIQASIALTESFLTEHVKEQQ